jgi:hypothetical protein
MRIRDRAVGRHPGTERRPCSAWLLLGLVAGCSAPTLPPPEAAARRFAEAAERGDADALYAMLTTDAQLAYGEDGTRTLVDESRRELAKVGRALGGDDLQVEARAVVRYVDGERAELILEDGALRIELSDALPTRASTPEAALAALRAALARRSFAAVLRLLSAETRAAVERDLDAVVDGLAEPETLEVEIDGDEARVALPDGHRVSLRREDGVWRVEALE